MLRPLPALMALVTVLLLAAGASAHGPPAKRDQDTRLLADHNDDCGGDDTGSLSNCHGTHDLVGLDLVERHDGGLGDVVVLRLTVNGGSGSLKDVITFKTNGAAKSFEFRTTDNQQFTGTGFASITHMPATNADGTTDGSRFVIEGSVKVADLGGVGAKLTDYKVEAYVGADKGDYMPGGYVGPAPLHTDNPNPSQGDSVTSFNRVNGYVLQGPTMYVSVAMPATASVRADGEEVVAVQLTNLLRGTAQLVTVSAAGADGFTATWVGANGADPAQLDLAKGGSGTAELRLRGDGHDATTGTLTITVSTSLGGYSVHQLPYEILAGENVGGPGTGHVDDTGDGSKGSPAPVAPLLALGLLALVGVRRRA